MLEKRLNSYTPNELRKYGWWLRHQPDHDLYPFLEEILKGFICGDERQKARIKEFIDEIVNGSHN